MKNIYVQVTEQDLKNIDIKELVRKGLLFKLVEPTRSLETGLVFLKHHPAVLLD